MKLSIAKAADSLLGGGVIAYPTEGVYGLGCMPDDNAAIARILAIKKRDPDMGLILIASNKEQLDSWVDPDGNADIPAARCGIRSHDVDNAPAQAACNVHWSEVSHTRHLAVQADKQSRPLPQFADAVDSPIISTSANIAGPPVSFVIAYVLRRRFGACVDYIVPGDCGPSSGPSEIRDLATGKVMRPRTP